MASGPHTYDYSGIERSCDVVMKGGITSGVVYPHAVCELAKTYRLRNVGGTSAGAIAAAAAGAAELGRTSGGFQKLAALPNWLSSGTNLFSLFQPQPRTKPVFQFLVAGLGSPKGRVSRLLGAGFRNFRLPMLAGMVPGAGLIILAAIFGHGVLLVASIVGGTLLFLLGGLVGLLAGLANRIGDALPANGFGLCSGLDGSAVGPALTPWLTDLLDDLAGRSKAAAPLTFGDLERGGVHLELMTTNLTQRRPQKLPWNSREFFFDPDEMRRLFPMRVVQWLEDHPPAAPQDERERRQWEALCHLLLPLRPLPAAPDLPVVVAARMSLSFPGLLSSVALWAVDASRRANQEALEEWRVWLGSHAEEWDHALKEDRLPDDAPAARPKAEPCWFSDGGITSNFPVHFFDSPLPTRPTFGMNLRPFHPDHQKSANEEENVYLPRRSGGGLLQWWYRFPSVGGLSQLSAFAQSVVRTMQNHADEAQMRLPGYRDRVVHINFSEGEGGMNLTMPPDVISALTARGRFAGARLVEQYARQPASPSALSWDSHRWTRFRSALSTIGDLVGRVERGYRAPPGAGERTYAELASRGPNDHPRAYTWARKDQQRLGADFIGVLEAAARVLGDAEPQSLAEGTPRPEPEARILPPE
jgi:predicted acylesterase/phospholipase RssA